MHLANPQSPTPNPQSIPPLRARLFPNHEWALLIVLLVKCAIFSVTGNNFFSAANAFEITRLSVEIGLLALALTPVIITGGIDLSVGSMMGLAAVVMGFLWRDAGVPLPLAIVIVLLLGLLGGMLNALLVTRLHLPPLIVTLGTFSLYRGLAEGVTRGVENFSGFPPQFLFLGQGYLGGFVPPQLLILLAAIAGVWWWLHRSIYGRSLYAIGFSPEGARYAGVPVAKRLMLVYVLSGVAASIAAVIYVAHLGQAKSDAGNGYELMAITAVVLGGTSIFGGRGTVLGTVLGLFAVIVLQNGLRLSGQPTELAGILTGALLLITILLDRFTTQRAARTATTNLNPISDEEPEVKNSQVAILSAVILGAAVIVAGSNWMLVRSLTSTPRIGTANETASASNANVPAPAADKKAVIAMMPKAKGDPYFVSCRKGAEEAAQQLGVELLWDGPTGLDAAKQNEVVEAWITRGVDAIAVAVENRAGISTVLRKAKQKGIKVLTWDADAEPDARDFFVNQATPEGIGYTLTDEAARIMGGKGEFAVITGALSAANQNEWIKYIKARLAEKYPDLKLVTIRPSDDDRDRAFNETQNVMKVFPNVKLIMAISAPAVPGSGEAVKQAGRKDVKVIGLSLPNLCKPYVHEGWVESVILWDTGDLGYLTVLASRASVNGELKVGAKDIQAGRLGKLEIKGDQIILGAPFIFNKGNIDQYDF
ncbi:MAG TPA: substrate-binding domain-containing protein [Blastocatellia bacterium]|nr:substrate-binding domain-containing protein [Blastocatellia bacterium]